MEKLGEILLRQKVISTEDLARARKSQLESGGKLSENLIKLGIISENELVSALSKQYGVPGITLSGFQISPDVIKLIPKSLAIKHNIIPVNRVGSTLIVAMSDPTDIAVIDEIKFITNLQVEPVVASEMSIKEAIEKWYAEQEGDIMEEVATYEEELGVEDVEVKKEEEGKEDVIDLARMAEEAPIVKLVNSILLDGIEKGASDIHVEPYENRIRIRYRIDGVLHEIRTLPIKLKDAVASRLKLISGMDIAENRLTQDGRIKLKIKDRSKGIKTIDFRVSSVPTIFGESIVLRILDKGKLQLDLDKLGFEQEALERFRKAIHTPYGMVLVTGPSGSGKTTTLYSAIVELNDVGINISTAEDPVEFNFMGINQVQVRDDIGLTFAAALRSFLRQDPDIIMVGEIRDYETAEVAIKAALTGHLVLSTLHTNDAPSTITRLLNMGVEPFMVTACVLCVVSQRLVRRICDNCKEPDDSVKDEMLIALGVDESKIGTFKPMRGKGCDICHGTGYNGRIGLYETMTLTPTLKEMILEGAMAMEIKQKAIEEGMDTLRMVAIKKLIRGETTYEEVLRGTLED